MGLFKFHYCCTLGFDIECKLKGSWTPLMYACESGILDVIELLLDAGANPNSNKGDFFILLSSHCLLFDQFIVFNGID